MNQIFVNAKKVLVLLAEMSDDMRSHIIHEVANSIITHQKDLLDANSDDLSRMDPESPIYDRLKLTTKRLKDIADSMHTVADMPSPVRRVVQHKVLPNGLDLLRQSVPYGVIGVIYEARPNVTFDVFSLCYKSGNACILKGGKDAQATNEAAVALIQEVLHRYSPTAYACQLMPATHEATAELLQARGYVDLCIPRGGKKLIEFVRDNAKVPCIETGAGVVHTFFDKSGDTDMGAAIINNAKTRRPAVCNSLDTLLIHELRLNDLPKLCTPLTAHQVRIYADEAALKALSGNYPAELLHEADDTTWDTEWMDYAMGVRTVHGMGEALQHISDHGSGHSECIITDDATRALQFQRLVDAACVYWNASTAFTDGGQFGLGAEIGISTQKLGPRGPMGIESLVTTKWIIHGHGQIRE